MAFRKAVHRLTTPTEQLDREALADFCATRDFSAHLGYRAADARGHRG